MNLGSLSRRQHGSVLVIVLWVALGLVTVTLYFSNSMSFELRASDNRLAGIEADQAIEGASRYVMAVLGSLATNGVVPDVTSYHSEGVPVGEARFWLIGRPADYLVEPDQVFFGLVDEGAKLNANTATLEMLSLLTNMTLQMAANIYDWRNTNGTTSENGDGPMIYAQLQPAYLCKNAPFETVAELKLVYPMDMGTLFGEDANLNGALDPGEMDTNRNGVVDGGLLEYLTVYSKEPNTDTNGAARVNISDITAASAELTALLQTNLTAERFSEVASRIGLDTGGQPGGQTGGGAPGGGSSTPGGGGRQEAGGATGGAGGSGSTGGTGGTGGTPASTTTFASPLAFYRASGLTPEEFAAVAQSLTATNGSFIEGRINVNTAPAAVLASLPGMDINLAQQLISYRQQSPDDLGSIAWVVEALGQNNDSALEQLSAVDCITTHSYQFSADIAAVGRHGRGYRRVKFVFDLSSGTPVLLYRQDLSHLGWALGRYVRQQYVAANDR